MEPSVASEETCPKCGHTQTLALGITANCPRCGLAREKMKDFADVAAPASAEVVAAWTQLVAAWTDGPRHAKFVDLARQLQALPIAARLYREYGQQHPTDQVARLQLERVVKLVQVEMSTVVAARLPPATMPYKKTIVMLVVIVILALSAWLYLSIIGNTPKAGTAPAGRGSAEELRQRADAQRRELMRTNSQRPIIVAPTPSTPQPGSAPTAAPQPTKNGTP